MPRTGFENLRVYQLAEEIADLIWEVVFKWDCFPQSTIGKQLVDSADSIGGNSCPVKQLEGIVCITRTCCRV